MKLEPMYASIGKAVPRGKDWTFEPKYDGVRVLAVVSPTSVELITRNGKQKTKQFPEVATALKRLAGRRKREMILDGEIVAMKDGTPERFQALQSRMHLKDKEAIARYTSTNPVTLVLFDILSDGGHSVLRKPWTERRALLVRRVGQSPPKHLLLTPSVRGNGQRMLRAARKDGWEGIIAKRIDAPYEPGIRSDQWLKLKVEFRQEFVVGGYTEPRNTRPYFGALLLGYFDGDKLIYVGHMGGGFTRRGLKEMYEQLKPLERKTSPFAKPIHTNEKAHWVTPQIVVEVKFSEWTEDRRLRQPIFLGIRDDKDARNVGRESKSVQS